MATSRVYNDCCIDGSELEIKGRGRLLTGATVTYTPKCFISLQTIVKGTATCIVTFSHPTPTTGIGTRTATGTGLSTPSPACSLAGLPSDFFLRTSNDSYLSVHGSSNRAANVPHFSNATAFHVRSTNDSSITGISQLAIRALDNDRSFDLREAGAWTQTSGFDYGSPIEFFDVERPPKTGNGYGIVTTAFSTYLCRMSLITWMDHDLSYPLDCQGELWLGGGSEDGPCLPVTVTVSTGIN